MKIKTKICILLTALVLVASSAFADVRITVAKGDASLCAIMPTQALKFNDRNVYHYNKIGEQRHISSDLWDSGKRGLPFFKLSKAQNTSQTVQLSCVDKYSTFWYYTKHDAEVNGPYFYDFIVPERDSYKEKLYVDIDLELPCSCFKRADRPQRCVQNDGVNIHIYKNKIKDWWQQTGKDKATQAGKSIGKKSHQAWDAAKGGAKNLKEGWDDYQDDK